MKKIFLIIPAASLIFSCSGNSTLENSGEGNAESKNETWVIKKAEGTLAEANMGTKYIFEGEKLTLSGAGMKNEGTYEMKGDTLVFHMKTFTGDMSYLKSMQGKQMVLKPVGSDQTFYLDKK